MAAELSPVPITALADVNPPNHSAGLLPSTEVSFIPMQDVSEGGKWTGHQTRHVSEVRVGHTPFIEGDVLFAKITPCMENGKGTHARGLVNGVGFGSTEFHVLRARGENCDRFIYHWSQAPALRLKAQAFMIGSAGQQRVQPDFFEHFMVPELPPPEQRRIAAVLDTLDEAIHRTEQVIAKLQQMRQGLLHDLLTRGVDENGDLRPPPEESPHLYKDSPLGRIPSCCHTVPLASLAAVNPRCHPAGLPSSAEVSFIPMQDVSEDGDWTGHQTRRFSEVSVGYTPFSEGDVLFAKITPCMENGKGTHARGLVNGIGFGSTEFHVLRAMGDNCDRFIYHWSRAPALRLKAQAFMIGSAGQQRVQPDFFEHFLVPGFPPSEQRRIAAILDAYDATIRRNREAVACWRQSKQGLLHDLLTGRVRVPDSIEVPA